MLKQVDGVEDGVLTSGFVVGHVDRLGVETRVIVVEACLCGLFVV